MPRALGVLALLLLAPVLSAQNPQLPADLSVSMTAVPERIMPGHTLRWSVTYSNAGPNLANGAYVNAQFHSYTCVNQYLTLAAGESKTFDCATTIPFSFPPYSARAQANVFYPRDTNPENDFTAQFVTFITGPDLRVGVTTNGLVLPGLPTPVVVTYVNLAFAAAEDARLTVDAPGAASISVNDSRCSVAGTRVTCELGDIAANPGTGDPFRRLELTVVMPEESDARVPVTAEISSPTADQVPGDNRHTSTAFNYRTFFVSNTNDSGAGSLREAIHSANASCGRSNPCLIAFRIPDVGAFASIVPRTPLPVITANNVRLDAQTQHLYTNRVDELPRPLIELRGSELSEGDGLSVQTPCGLIVRGLAINGFPRNGVHIGATETCDAGFSQGRYVEANYIGTDPTGERAMPNQRGVFVDSVTGTGIYDNVISGNTRAGVFIARARSNYIVRNVIGLNASGTKPLGNGASGVYIGAEGRGTDVSHNHIAFNRDSGISVATGALYVNTSRNAIHANDQIAIDHGLDGPTPRAPLTTPEIVSAQYDPASNTTSIIVRMPPNTQDYGLFHVYANDAPDPGGYGEAQYYLGQAQWNPAAARWEFIHPGDLRGKWVAAQLVHSIITTFGEGPYANTTSSEIGRAMEVQ